MDLLVAGDLPLVAGMHRLLLQPLAGAVGDLAHADLFGRHVGDHAGPQEKQGHEQEQQPEAGLAEPAPELLEERELHAESGEISGIRTWIVSVLPEGSYQGTIPRLPVWSVAAGTGVPRPSRRSAMVSDSPGRSISDGTRLAALSGSVSGERLARPSPRERRVAHAGTFGDFHPLHQSFRPARGRAAQARRPAGAAYRPDHRLPDRGRAPDRQPSPGGRPLPGAGRRHRSRLRAGGGQAGGGAVRGGPRGLRRRRAAGRDLVPAPARRREDPGAASRGAGGPPLPRGGVRLHRRCRTARRSISTATPCSIRRDSTSWRWERGSASPRSRGSRGRRRARSAWWERKTSPEAKEPRKSERC